MPPQPPALRVRLLRTLVYWDLNVDEDGRESLDGIIANVAGGMRGEFNQRFGQNSKDRPQMMAHVFPSTDVATTDPVTGATDALHGRLDARGSRLKVFHTNTSAEYHRGDASLVHTDPDGRRDVADARRVVRQLLVEVEKRIGLKVDIAKFIEIPTVARMTLILTELMVEKK